MTDSRDNKKRTRSLYEDDDTIKKESYFKYDSNGNIIGFPENIKIINSTDFNLNIQPEDQHLVYKIIEFCSKLASKEIIEEKYALEIEVLIHKNHNKIIDSYIIKMYFPLKMIFDLFTINNIIGYNVHRVRSVKLRCSEPKKKMLLETVISSSTNHTIIEDEWVYISQAKVKRVYLDNVDDNDDTKIVRRTKQQ